MGSIIRYFTRLIFFVLAVIVLAVIGYTFMTKDINVTLVNGDIETEYVIEQRRSYILPSPEKHGYTFKGWYDKENEGIRYTDESGQSFNDAASDFPDKLYAQYESNKYNLYIDDVLYDDVLIEYGKAINPLPLPSSLPDHREFIGYVIKDTDVLISDDEGNLLNDFDSINDDNFLDFNIENNNLYLETVTDYVDVRINYYQGTTLLPAVEDKYNGYLTPYWPTNPEGKLFIGWYLDESLLTPLPRDYIINQTSPINLYGKFLDTTNEVLSFSSIENDSEYEVSLSLDSLDTIVIPDTYFGKPVTKIGDFSGCNASHIYMPNSIELISEGAFEDCINLEFIDISYQVSVIPRNAFKGNISLDTFEFIDNISVIGEGAFENNIGLESIYIGDSVVDISEKAFVNTPKLSEVLVSEENSIYVSQDNILFRVLGTNRNLVLYPGGLQETHYVIPDNVLEIESYAFAYQSNLTKIEITNNVRRIHPYAFSNMPYLNLVDLDMNLDWFPIAIEEESFINNTSLKSFIIRNMSLIEIDEAILTNSTSKLNIYVRSELLSSYTGHDVWSNYNTQFRSLSYIYGDYIVDEVNISDTTGYEIVHYIGNEEVINIPAVINATNIISIGEMAFAYHFNLEEITISEHILQIEADAFLSCDDLSIIRVKPLTPFDLDVSAFDVLSDDAYIYILNADSSVINAYKSAPVWVNYSDLIYTSND